MRDHPVHLGELTEQIELYHRTLTDDGSGGATMTETLYATVWAHMRPMSGREQEQAMRSESRSRFLAVIRNRTDVVQTDILKWDGREFNVNFIKLRGFRGLYLEMECELGASV